MSKYTKHTIHQKDLITYKKNRFARSSVAKALKEKKILRPKKCELCEKRSKTEAHHVDYGRPLFVYWLCCKCHGVVHRKNHPLNPNNNQQTPCNFYWKGTENVPVTVTIPFENFIFIDKIAKEKGVCFSKLVRGFILKEFEVQDDQIKFNFTQIKERENDKSLHDRDERICNLEEDAESMLQSKNRRLQEIRRERNPSLFSLDGELSEIFG